jgi:hypothetical protein
MKDLAIAYWKWLAVGILLALLAVLVGTGLGTKRGTRLYRLRVRLWSATVALAAAGGLVLSSSGCRDKDDERPMCYDTVLARDAGIDDGPGGSEGEKSIQDEQDAVNGPSAEDPAADDGTAAEEPRKGKKGKPAGKNRKKKSDTGFISCYFPADME